MDKPTQNKQIGDSILSVLVGLLIGYGSNSIAIGLGVAIIYYRIAQLEKN